MKPLLAFDFADTIAVLHPPREQVWMEYIRQEFNVNINRSDILLTLLEVDKKRPYSSVNCINAAQHRSFYVEYNKLVFETLGFETMGEPDLFYDYIKAVNPHWTLKSDVEANFKSFKASGYKIAIISNFDSSLSRVLGKELRISHLLDYVHISQEIGYEKPDQEFFAKFFELNDLDAKSTYYIGDSLTLDYYPAKNYGMKSHHLAENNNGGEVEYSFETIGAYFDYLRQELRIE